MSQVVTETAAPAAGLPRLLGAATAVAAVAASAMALTDAVTVGLTGHGSVVTEGPPWVAAVVSATHGVAFLLLAAVLVTRGAVVDAGSRARRWLRRLLAGLLVLLGVPYLISAVVPFEEQAIALTGPMTAAFVLAFPVGGVLGLLLLRRPGLRVAGAVMAAALPAVVLAVVLGAVGSTWAHPAYAEVALYLGTAMLAGTAPAAARRPDVAAGPAPAAVGP